MPWKNLLFALLGAAIVSVGIFGENLKFYESQHHWFRPNRKIPNWQGRLVSIIVGILFIVGAIFARH
jgi:hypothetical protein